MARTFDEDFYVQTPWTRGARSIIVATRICLTGHTHVPAIYRHRGILRVGT